MRIFLHRTLPRMTSTSAEELAEAAHHLKLDPACWKEGYCQLTCPEYSRALHIGRTIDDVSFENLVKAIDREEIEI